MKVNKTHNYYQLLFLTILFQSCIYEYNPKLEKYENLLVVYGIITDQYGPHKIVLSRTASVYGYSSIPESKAIVSISDDKGNVISLREKGSGTYLTPESFKGIPGENYKINIITENGLHYESEYVNLTDVPEIKYVDYEFTTKKDEKTGEDLEGYQFYVSTDGENQNQKYFRWELGELWEIRMPYNITHYWTGDSLIQVSYPNRCWRSNQIEDIFIASTEEYQTNSIKSFPLHFTSVESDRLSVKYSLTVYQYLLSEKSYFFWRGQIENTQAKGSLYDKQPYQVIGNIKCIDNPKEIVLGIFEASEISIKQIYLSKPDVNVSSGFESCESEEYSGLSEFERKRPYYASFTMMDSIVVINNKCVDCEASGATTAIPQNWDEVK